MKAVHSKTRHLLRLGIWHVTVPQLLNYFTGFQLTKFMAASLWRAGTRISLVASALGAGGAAALIATSDDPATALKLSTTIPHRLFRDAIAAANIAFGTVDLTQPPSYPKFLWFLTKILLFHHPFAPRNSILFVTPFESSEWMIKHD